MKIAIVYDVMYPYGLGGGEKRNWEVARRLAKRGHDVSLVSMQMWDGAAEFTREGVRCVGVCRSRPGLTVGGKRSFWQPLYFAWHLYSYMRRNDFDVIDCSNFPYLSCLAVRAATMFSRARLVITWYEARGLRRWMEHRGPLVGGLAWLFEWWIARLSVFNTAISEFTAENAKSFLGVRNMAVVPCGVDCEAIAPAARVQRENQVLYVGRLTRYKRVDTLIEAFARIAGPIRGCTLKIVGKGYEREKLQADASRLGLDGRIVFCDGLSEQELSLEYAKSKVFVLPSEQEGFGIVLIEAMAAGVPVIARKAPHSAADRLVDHGKNGLLVANVEEMATALGEVLADGGLAARLAAAGVETARRYDWDGMVVPALEKYYREAASR
ncbi:MAG: glycosyltransferase family 4 protein [bacterium]